MENSENFLPMYATVDEVEAGFRELTTDERNKCTALIGEAGVLIDAVNVGADATAKKVVVCRMVRRALGSDVGVPMGATQGSVSALGYSQSWTVGSSGSTGELYIGKAERTILGMGNKIGASNPYGGECVD